MLIKCLLYCHEVQHPLKVLERQTQSLENQFSNFMKKNIIFLKTYCRSAKRSRKVGIASLGFTICKKLGERGCRMGDLVVLLSWRCCFIHSAEEVARTKGQWTFQMRPLMDVWLGSSRLHKITRGLILDKHVSGLGRTLDVLAADPSRGQCLGI